MKICFVLFCVVFVFVLKIEASTAELQEISTPFNTSEVPAEDYTDTELEDREIGTVEGRRRCASCRCGIRNLNKEKIVGGTEAIPHEFPWMAMLQIRRRFFCGGALINDRYVLTAAHCLRGKYNIRDLTVTFGEHNRNDPKDSKLIVKHVVKATVHPKYNPLASKMNDNDLALLKLASPVEMSRNVKPICLPQREATFTGKKATIAGWGRTSEEGKSSPVLRKVQVPIMSNRVCARVPGFRASLTKNMMCAGFLRKGGKDTCQGDSGGALMVESKSRRIVIAGIVSWGVGCARVGNPGVYTRVTNYLKWIRANTRDACYCH